MSYVNGPNRGMMEASMQSARDFDTRRTAQAAESTKERIEQLVAAMETQLELARASQATAERSERFARRMAWWSLGVAIASAGAAIAAIVVSILPKMVS